MILPAVKSGLVYSGEGKQAIMEFLQAADTEDWTRETEERNWMAITA